MDNTAMFINETNIGVSNVEFDKSNLLVTDKSKKYTFGVTIYYNWKDIKNISVGEGKNIDFNEYVISENNESALIYPTISKVKKLDEDAIFFYFKFDNMKDICYMNKKNSFDIKIENLEIRVYINFKDSKNGIIKYNFN